MLIPFELTGDGGYLVLVDGDIEIVDRLHKLLGVQRVVLRMQGENDGDEQDLQDELYHGLVVWVFVEKFDQVVDDEKVIFFDLNNADQVLVLSTIVKAHQSL